MTTTTDNDPPTSTTTTLSSQKTTTTKRLVPSNRTTKLPTPLGTSQSTKRRFSSLGVPNLSQPTYRLRSNLAKMMDTDNLFTTIATSSQSLEPLIPDVQDFNTHPEVPSWVQDLYSRVNAHSQQIKEMNTLIQRNAELQSALDAALKRIKELESTTTPTNTQPAPATMTNSQVDQFPALNANPLTIDSIASSYAQAASNATPSRRMPKKKTRKFTIDVPESRQAAARGFLPVSETQGFQFIYLPNRGREKISVMRNRLAALGIQNSRVLDIHYPDRHVAAFLVHNDYASTFIANFNNHNISPITDFDPLDTNHLRDPKYKDASAETLSSEALRLHQDRLQYIITRIHHPNRQLAVARDFCFQKQWITKTQYDTIFHKQTPLTTTTTHITIDSDTQMNDITTQFQPGASSRADDSSAPLS